MKEGIHPDNYRTVIFKDLTADWRFLGKSCAESKENEAWDDGNEYPVIKVEVSSASHPFYTGKNTLVDTAGRIDKFRTRYAKHKK
jgi:large subunit ribosomal protein L31